MTSFHRRLSPYEKMYLAARDADAPLCIQFFIEGQGVLQRDRLVEAVTFAAEHYPGCRLVLEKDEWVDTGRAPPVIEVPIDEMSEAALMQRPLDPFSGPSCEVLIIRGPSTRIAFRASHAVMDARGLLFWAQEVFRALRGDHLEQANSVVSDYEWLRTARPSHPRRGLMLDAPAPYKAAQTGQAGCHFGRISIPANTPALVARLAAYLAGQCGEDVLFMIPVDLRAQGNIQTTANFSAPVFLEVSPGEAWEAIYARLLAMLQRHEEQATASMDRIVEKIPLPWLAAGMRFLRGHAYKKNCYPVSAILSHMGTVKLADFSMAHFQARDVYFLPLYVPGLPLTVSGLEYEGQTQIALCLPRAIGSAEQVHVLLRGLQNQIKAPAYDDKALPLPKPAPYPRGKTVFDLFEQQVRTTPDAIAVSHGKTRLTYDDIYKRVDRLAARLITQNVQVGDRVAIHLDHSPEIIISLLAVMKVGGVFIPLDKHTPPARMTEIFDDARVKVLLTDQSRHGGITCIHPASMEEEPLSSVSNQSSAMGSAYIIYTSGSTGKPKGVEVAHRSLVNYLVWAGKTYLEGKIEKPVFALSSSPAFDLTFTSFFLPLIYGGEIVIYSSQKSVETLRHIIEEGKANCLKLTPSHLKILCATGVVNEALRCLIVGGENFSTQLAYKADQLFKGRLGQYNEYGPTETTIGCMVHLYNREEDKGPSVPIGVAAGNFAIHLLDAQMNPAPPMANGEIYIAGDGLAVGYVNDAALTSEKFIHHRGQRLYRTGDLAYRTADGIIHYLGRIDRQVKINGYRVELAEVEAVLQNLDNIEEAVVLSIEAGSGSALAAFIRAAAPLDIPALRNSLAQKLPPYMVPDHFQEVAFYPLTANGKLDEKALRDSLAMIPNDAAYDANLDQRLCMMVSAIMQKPPSAITSDASLFDLGCDSLNFVALLEEVHRSLLAGQESERFTQQLQAWFENPTLANLAEKIREAKRA